MYRCTASKGRVTASLVLAAGLLTLGGVFPSSGPTQTELDEVNDRLDRIEAYLQAQAKQTEALGKAVERSVKEGFTAGINFHSRETLVEAWRDQAKAAGRKVPGVKKPTLEK